ncbi:hypothetical protein E4631_14710 [Hymenobacter sp. UV11]|uniref:hypothetical protein n=1 Tax=Hymenobacter sp. UV11 TaxID=1849735 RepID=UPI00105BE096|nr:hypothetical protein [Hymenobacter sp. UV11]TDN39430.1 hypothetical protein A8B98_19510 [Hymenobacter sp. UV11]TFZ65482.1 hypothetical protein E4631_14710 [Hymenobacter sp. UV11]
MPPADTARATPTPLFVEVLVSGPARFYTCRDHGRTRYFVAVGPAGARLRELAERRVKTFSNGFEAYESRSLFLIGSLRAREGPYSACSAATSMGVYRSEVAR